MISDNDFNFEDIDWSDTDKLLEELKNQPSIQLDSLNFDIAELLEETDPLLPEISFNDQDIRKMLESLSSADSELHLDLSEADLSTLLRDAELASIEPEEIPEPDPNLTAKDVAAWMLSQVESKGKLYQKNAAWRIRRYFGERFIYLNKNHNPAISQEVLKEFLLISLKTVVWNKQGRYWRLRRSNDPISRSID